MTRTLRSSFTALFVAAFIAVANAAPMAAGRWG
jgi:hypothetical protein